MGAGWHWCCCAAPGTGCCDEGYIPDQTCGNMDNWYPGGTGWTTSFAQAGNSITGTFTFAANTGCDGHTNQECNQGGWARCSCVVIAAPATVTYRIWGTFRNWNYPEEAYMGPSIPIHFAQIRRSLYLALWAEDSMSGALCETESIDINANEVVPAGTYKFTADTNIVGYVLNPYRPGEIWYNPVPSGCHVNFSITWV